MPRWCVENHQLMVAHGAKNRYTASVDAKMSGDVSWQEEEAT
jgi:hypothetical protein